MIAFSLLLVGISSPTAHARTTTADFLKWERKSQDAFFQTSMSMLTTVSAQVKPQVAECLNDWYFKGENENKRHTEMIEIMPQYLEFHPSTVVLAYIESVCGRLDKN